MINKINLWKHLSKKQTFVTDTLLQTLVSTVTLYFKVSLLQCNYTFK